MKFAEYRGKRIAASPGFIGATCPCCKTEVIPRCGKKVAHHWAHKNKSQCDNWWEPHSDWSLSWQEKFEVELQEPVITRGQETHFASIKTKNNTIVLIRQRLTPKIVEEQEKFFQTLVWIVNAGRHKHDSSRLIQAFRKRTIVKLVAASKNETFRPYIVKAKDAEKIFRKEWLVARFPMLLDYSTSKITTGGKYTYIVDYVWCLFPLKVNGYRVLLRYEKEEVIAKLMRRKGKTKEQIWKLKAFFEKKLFNL